MGGVTNYLRLGSCLAAMCLASASHAQETARNSQEQGASPAPAMAARQRAVTFTVPLVSQRRAYGDVLIEVGANGGDVRVQTEDLQRELAEILNPEGRSALSAVVSGQPFVSAEQLRAAGFELVFNTSQLELVVTKVPPEYREIQTLIPGRDSGNRTELERTVPASFSSYLNVIANADYSTRFGTETPDLFLAGATRAGGVVAEYDGAFTDQFGDSYRFVRRSTRLVYDDPDSFRRYSAGDLRLDTLSILTIPQIAGIGVERRRRLFEPGLSALRLNGRQIFLNNRSTVEVRVNGAVVESLQLDAGTYDLSSLPIQQGSNDIELVVRDSFGQEQVIAYDFFFESLPLEAGEVEYSLGVGVLSDNLGFEPNYTDNIALSGLYRRAFSENLIVGGALQVSETVQVAGANVISVPQFIPGVVELEVAASRSSGEAGMALRAGYRYSDGGGIAGSNEVAFNVSYESAGFTNLNNLLPIDFDLLSFTATYTRSFSIDTLGTFGATYFTGGPFPNDYSLFFDFNHRLNDRLRLTAGAEYGLKTQTRSAFGVRVGIALALGRSTRAAAEYRSRFNNFRANVSRGADNDVGAFGYDFGISQFGDDTRADAQLEYEANRFSARADLTSRGGSIGGITEEQRARIQIGTSIAVAGGQFGIGRPINSAFLLAKPNSAIDDQNVITGRSLRTGQYYAQSGPFGSALQGDLAAYSAQNVQYDAADPNNSFDVGDGTVLVEPPYKSGYAIIVGDENYVSLIGTLIDENGPVAVSAGVIVDLETGEPLDGAPFFTNAAGRFGLFGLAPGKRYEIRLTGSDRTFVIEIPEKTNPIIRMGPITLPSNP